MPLELDVGLEFGWNGPDHSTETTERFEEIGASQSEERETFNEVRRFKKKRECSSSSSHIIRLFIRLYLGVGKLLGAIERTICC